MAAEDPKRPIPGNDRGGQSPGRSSGAPNPADESSKHPPPDTWRKRATKACLACRARKVRCDVALCGSPCRNCRINGGDCTVIGRPTKYRTSKKKQRENNDQRAQPRSVPLKPLPKPDTGDEPHGSDLIQSGGRPLTSAQSQTHQPSQDVNANRDTCCLDNADNERPLSDANNSRSWEMNRNYPVYVSAQDEQGGVGSVLPGQSWEQVQPVVDDLPFLPVDTTKQNAVVTSNHDVLNGGLLNQICGILGAQQPYSTPPGNSQNSLVKPDDLSQSPPQDVEFLKAQGCFQIPVGAALEEFVRRYFIHVHPHLPMFDESAFWTAFDGLNGDDTSAFPISIFTFQAMLFASSSFVPLNVLHDVGFESIRDARKVLYRRAKLLFDFKGKMNCMSTAQGALLLSYTPDTNNRKDNSFWLGVAIQNARAANSHAYDSVPMMTEEERNTRKRLFWCCILRDRILPLGLRRPVFITGAHFQFNNTSPLNAKDLENETMYSKVYDPETKRSLADLVASLCELAVVLTDVIMILYPVNELPVDSLSDAEVSSCRTRIRHVRADLTSWYEKANVEFPTPAGLGGTHESVILYTNLMYLYYHSARMALCHHELLISNIGDKQVIGGPVQLNRSKGDLQEAAGSMTEIMKELLQLRLVKYLPISTVAYIVLPLVLNILDVKLSRTNSQYATRQRRLQIFMDAMKVFQFHYDGTDRVSDAVERLIGYLAINNRTNDDDDFKSSSTGEPRDSVHGGGYSSTTDHGHRVTEWGDVLVRLPNCYLRIAITLDLALSKGEFPDELDFPPWLRTSRLANSLPLYRKNQEEGAQNIAGTPRADNSARVFDKYDETGKNDPRPARGNPNFQTYSQPYPRETMDGDYRLAAVSGATFDARLPQHGGLGGIPAATDVPQDLQLDAWMFDVFQNFH